VEAPCHERMKWQSGKCIIRKFKGESRRPPLPNQSDLQLRTRLKQKKKKKKKSEVKPIARKDSSKRPGERCPRDFFKNGLSKQQKQYTRREGAFGGEKRTTRCSYLGCCKKGGNFVTLLKKRNLHREGERVGKFPSQHSRHYGEECDQKRRDSLTENLRKLGKGNPHS